MANAYFNQFFKAQDNELTGIQGVINLVQPVQAAVTGQGITYTAVPYGNLGNDITITIVGGGTAGAEVVTVVGKAITVQVEAGVSTRTQVETAVEGDVDAAALVSVSVVSGSTTVSAATAITTTGGVNMASSSCLGVASVLQTGTGQLTITLRETFPALLSAQFQYGAASAVDLVPQVGAVDVASAKTIVVRLQAGATPTNPAAAGQLYMSLMLRNSSVAY